MLERLRLPHQLPDLPAVAHVPPLRPLRWLESGWDDLRSNPGPSIAHGLLLVMIGWLILLFCARRVDLLAAAVSAYMIVGPIAGAAFFELSRLRSSGEPAGFDESIEGAWRRGRGLASLGLSLAALAIAWVVISDFLFRSAYGDAPPSLDDVFYWSVFDSDYAGFFVTYLSTGGIVALIAFVVSAVSAPMIFDRTIGTTVAMVTSVRAMAVNPGAMAVWAMLIALLTAAGFATFLLGLAIILPWLGHATWHAYRDLVA